MELVLLVPRKGALEQVSIRRGCPHPGFPPTLSQYIYLHFIGSLPRDGRFLSL
jgi:hypothetical protein